MKPGRFVSVALSRGRPRWTLSSILPCGVRTFLSRPCGRQRQPVRLRKNKSIIAREMTLPENDAQAVGTAQDLLALLQVDESLRRDDDMAALTYAFADRNDDGIRDAVADEIVAGQDGRGNSFGGLPLFLLQDFDAGAFLGQFLIQGGLLGGDGLFEAVDVTLQGFLATFEVGKVRKKIGPALPRGSGSSSPWCPSHASWRDIPWCSRPS